MYFPTGKKAQLLCATGRIYISSRSVQHFDRNIYHVHVCSEVFSSTIFIARGVACSLLYACNFPRISGVVKNNPRALMAVVNSTICQIRNTRAKCPCCYYYGKHIEQTGFCLSCVRSLKQQQSIYDCEIFGKKSDTSFGVL